MAKTVLIVEDDDDTRTIYRDALSDRGYCVLTATQGAEGVHLARTRRPDLILMDIRMPVMDGWSTLPHLKGYQETRRIPLFAISAYHSSDRRSEERDGAAFDAFLMKPLDPAAVVAAVEARIGAPVAGSATTTLEVTGAE